MGPSEIGLSDFFSKQDGSKKQKQQTSSKGLPPVDLNQIVTSEGADHLKPVIQAIYNQESGGGSNARTSSDGARGGMQIMPGTFKRFAKPGESIDNPDDNMRVGVRIIKDLGDKFGNDPAKIATGYFSGEGNVNNSRDQAFKKDHADGNGKRVSSYVGDILAALGGVSNAHAEGLPDTPKPDLDKAPKWMDIAINPEFTKLSPDQQSLAKKTYFDHYVRPHAGGHADSLLRQFMDAPNEPRDRTLGEVASDTGAQLAEGVNNILGAVPNLISPEGSVADFFNRNSKYWQDQQSDPLKARISRADTAIKAADADGVMAQIAEAAGQYFSDPSLAARFIVTNLPSMIPGIAAAKIAQTAALARGASAAKAGTLATTAAGATGAVLNAGGSRGEAFNDIKETLIKQGMPADQAEEAALKDSKVAAAVGGLAGFVSGKTGLENSLFGQGTSKSAVKAFAKGAAAELGGEQLEEVAPKVTTNYLAGQYDNRNLGQDVGRTIVETGIASSPGATFSGGVSAANTFGRPDQPEQPEQPPVNPQDETQPAQPEATQQPIQPQAAAQADASEHPTVQAANAIVRDLAQQAGIPEEVVLPKSPLSPDNVSKKLNQDTGFDKDVLNFAEGRLNQLLEKRDGHIQTGIGDNGLSDQVIQGQGLSPQEQQELDALQSVRGNVSGIKDLYGLNPQPTPEEKHPDPVNKSNPVESAPVADRSDEDLRQQMRNANDNSVRNAIADELRKRDREKADREAADKLVTIANEQAKKTGETGDSRVNAQVEKAQETVRNVEAAHPDVSNEVNAAAHEAATSPENDRPEPTQAQKEAGNYKKGHLNFDGLDISVENPSGSKRSGTDHNGKPWSVDMSAHYGYLKRSEGADGDQVDVYVPENPVPGSPVYVFDQFNHDGKFDEHKAVVGVPTQEEAQQVYDAHFSDGTGPQRRRGVTAMSASDFKQWAQNGDTKKPLSKPKTEREAKERKKRIAADTANTEQPAGKAGADTVTKKATKKEETKPKTEKEAKARRAKQKEISNATQANETKQDETPGTAETETPAESAVGTEQQDTTKFAKNKIFTAAKVAAARERLKSKLNTLNSGIDPELLQDGITLAGAYIESGFRTFGEYSDAMINDLGKKVRPYLRSFYEAARHYPGLDTTGMTTADEIDGVMSSKSASDAKSNESPSSKRNVEIVLPDNTTLMAQWDIVDADSVKASLKEGQSQPRDRTRTASDLQIQSISNNPDYRRLSDSPVMDVGAPVLSQDGQIVGGNGRFEAISRAYDQQTAQDYLDQLKSDAARKGLDTSVIDGMNKPVLVRRISQPFDTRKLAIASNSGTSAPYSALENAKIDSERIGDIGNLDINDSGDIALTPKNMQIIRDSMRGYTAAEQSSFVDSSGNLSQEGARRFRNAILYNAYGDSDTLSRLIESTDNDMRNIAGALMRVAGDVAKVRYDIKKGAIPKELDITDDLIGSVEKIAQLRAQNIPVQEYLSQQDIFGDGLNEDSKQIIAALNDNIRSQNKIANFIRAVYDGIGKIDISTGDMLGNAIPSKGEAIQNAKQSTAEKQGKQAGIFERPADKSISKSREESKADADTKTGDEKTQGVNPLFSPSEKKSQIAGKGIQLFTLNDGDPIPEPEWLSIGNFAQVIEDRIGQFLHHPPIFVMDSVTDIPNMRQASAGSVAGATTGGKIYIFRDANATTADITQTLWHELLHYGLRRFFTKEQYITAMRRLYDRDMWIRSKADAWMASDGDDVKQAKKQGMAYLRARGVDEALAELAEINEGEYRNNSLVSKAIRQVLRWVTALADKFGFHDFASKYRSISNDEARALIRSTFQKLREDAPATSVDKSFKASAAFSPSKSDEESKKLKTGDGGNDTALMMGDKKNATPETINVDGIDRPTRNSNGIPIYPTEEGIFDENGIKITSAKDMVRYLYANKMASTLDLSKSFDVSQSTINRWIRAFGINRSPRESQGVPDAYVDQAIELYKSGLSSSAIASKLGGVSKSTVKRWISDAGIARTVSEARGATEEKKKAAVDLYNSGIGAYDIARQLGVTNRGVYGWITEAGVKIRSKSEAQSFRAEQGRQPIRGVRSILETRFGDIRADSVYEAARIKQLEMDHNISNVNRSTDKIKWGNNKTYTPDLIVTTKNGDVTVEEIKPTFQINRSDVLEKAEAARLKFGENVSYKIVSTEDLSSGFDLLANDAGIKFFSDEDSKRFKKALATAKSMTKSATGNTGAFSENDDSILFRKGGKEPDDYSSSVDSAQEKLFNFFGQDKEKSPKNFGAYHKTLSTQYHKALTDPHYGKVFSLANAMQNHVSLASIRPSELAPGVLPRVDDVKSAAKGLFKGAQNQKYMKKVSDAMFAGTLAGKDVTGGRVWDDTELKNVFGLDKTGISLYRQARAAVDASIDELAAAEGYAMAQHIVPKDMRRMIIDEPVIAGTLLKSEVERQANVLNIAIQSARKRGDDAGAARLSALQESYTSTLKNLNTIFDTAAGLKKGGYAPLMRFGKWTVTAQEIDPQTGAVERDDNGSPATVYFGKFDTESEAMAALDRMKEKYKDRNDIRIESGIDSEDSHQLYAGISPETVALFGEAIGAGDVANKYYQIALSERSALKRRLERKGTPGYSEDLPRVLSNFITSNGRFSAQRYYLRDLNESIRTIPQNKGDVKDEAIQLKQFIVNPGDPAAPLSTVMFAWFLGGSVAAAMVNMTQPVMMTGPYLSRFGMKSATSELTKAIPYAMGKKEITDKSLKDALQRASREGVVDAQEIFHLYSIGAQSIASGLIGTLARIPGAGKAIKAGNDNARARINAFLTLWSSMFSLAEKFNRKLTFIAAWNMAKEKGNANPYDFAVRAVNETQGIYNKVNRPNWARNPAGRTILTFKQFSLMYVEMLSRMWKRGGPEGKRAALIMLGVLMLAAGEEGLPFAQDLDDLIDTIGQLFGLDTNMRRNKREAAYQILGDKLGDMFMYGISSQMPLDVSGRLGLGNFIPGTGLLKKSDEQMRTRNAIELLGPAAGMGSQLGDAYDAATEGNSGKALQNLAPKAIKDILAAEEMVRKGHSSDFKGRKVVDVGLSDAAIKASGFNPTKIANVHRKTMPLQQDISLQKITETSIANQWARGIMEDDKAMIDEAKQRQDDWNKKNPRIPIAINGNQIRDRVRSLNTDKNTRILKESPKEMRGRIGLELLN